MGFSFRTRWVGGSKKVTMGQSAPWPSVRSTWDEWHQFAVGFLYEYRTRGVNTPPEQLSYAWTNAVAREPQLEYIILPYRELSDQDLWRAFVRAIRKQNSLHCVALSQVLSERRQAFRQRIGASEVARTDLEVE